MRAGVGLIAVRQVFEQDGEFIATDPGDRVRGPHRLLQALRGHPQDAIAGGVAERVVDVLEAVQVEEQQRHASAVAACTHDRPGQALGKQRAVRQVRQRVVIGQVAQFLLDAATIGDVRCHHHEHAPLRHRLLDRMDLHGAQVIVAVLALLPHLARPMALLRDRHAGLFVEGEVMLFAVEHAGVLADDLGCVIAADPGERRIDRHEAECVVDHHDRFGHVVHDFGGNPAFAFLLTTDGDVAGGARDPGDAAGFVARDCATTRAHPLPLAVMVLDAVFREEHLRFAGDVGPQPGKHQLQVVWMDLVIGIQVDAQAQVVLAIDFDGGAFHLVPFKVVLPVEFVGRPQRQPQPLFALTQGAQMLALLLFPPTMAHQQHGCQQQDQQSAEQGQRA